MERAKRSRMITAGAEEVRKKEMITKGMLVSPDFLDTMKDVCAENRDKRFRVNVLVGDQNEKGMIRVKIENLEDAGDYDFFWNKVRDKRKEEGKVKQ